jgi:plastocyanin
MPPEAGLVEAYLQGQVSRRTFIRRLVASGISLGAAITYADVLWAEPAWAGPSTDFYCAPEPAPADFEIQVASAFAPTPLVVNHGACVRWRFAQEHSVRNELGFLASGFRPNDDFYNPADTDTYTRRFIASGTFDYFCEHPSSVHPPMFGQVIVPMFREPKKDEVGERFRIFWASVPAPPGFGYDVQIRRPGGDGGGGGKKAPANWDNWKKNVDRPNARFRPREPGRYKFRARVRNDAGAVSGWSPPISIRATD